MESNKEGEIEMLPVVRQDMPGAGAEHHSLWETSGRELRVFTLHCGNLVLS
jgi:hypothetical protein